MRYKRHYGLLVTFLVGIILGSVLMSLLSMKASKVYLEIIKTNYKQEQEILGDQSLRNGKLNEALIHYSNVVQAISGEIKSLDYDHVIKWSYSFPFAAIVLGEIKDSVDKSVRARKLNEGIARAKLGMVLESLGRREEAQREYLLAAKLMGRNIDDVKKLTKMLKGIINDNDIPSSLFHKRQN